MKAKILVAEVPFAASLIDVLDDILRDEAVCEEHDCSCFAPKSRVEREPIFEAPTFSEPTTTCGCRPTPRPEWGIAGKPADENKVFGAAYEIDEPRQEDYSHRWQFESDHEAFDKFVSCVRPGGKVFFDSTMIEPETDRTDIELYGIPSQQMADDNQLKGGSNIILLGKLLKETNICSLETMQKAIEKVVPPKKAALIPNNFKAIELGMNA